ncbi:MBL fold metallo-hydrolase [Peredibacter sp. HCB2-198]|uniref:MBL fold metallo-hydrolase n=1 Tax=Peredibacter sp. HCB2-198 TaxID=3383025 RepID=UPI0038B53256
MSKIIDAVSIVMTCGDEIFAIQRQNYLAAFPGYWAFPGGKVEAEDTGFCSDHDLCKNIDLRLFGAVVREGKEEFGIDLHEEIKKGNVRSVDYLGLAVTPDFNPYRFATYFFKIDLTKKLDFVVDQNEASFAEWMSSEQLLEKYNEGKVLAVPPVIKVIETLGKQPDVKHIENLITTYDNNKFVPYIENLKGMRQIMPLSHTLPPATRTNAFLIGDDVRIVVDPSPRDDEEYEKFKNTVAIWGAHKILITHHHPDHYERANKYAREMNLPVLLSRDTHMRITRSQPDFFNGIDVQFVKEGDVVTKWLGNDVLIMEIPGHDEGQIALYSKDLSWYLAGDLFQGIGTVVIGGEEGDMRKYFATLERIIKLSPKVIFPSHGIGLGGTTILEKTLAHRKQRESQVLNLHLEGLSPEQMLEKIYADVNKNLWPYALENIHKHLTKLKQDKIIS